MSSKRLMVIPRGSTAPVEVYLFGEHDEPESLAGADQAAIYIRETPSSSTFIFRWRTVPPATGTPNLTIDIPGSRLVGTLTQLESLALPLGFWVADAAVRFGNNDSWKITEAWDVRIIQPNAA